MAKPELKAKAIELRKQGLSYKEILSEVPVAKSTLSLWLRNIELTNEQINRLKEREEKAKFGSPDRDKQKDIEASKRDGYIGGKIVQQKYGEYIQSNLIKDGRIGSLHYRKDELPVKEKLEKITGMEFKKEQIGNKFYDFTNDVYIIEHTSDGTKGLSDAIDRLNSVPDSDNRIRVMIVKTSELGPKRRSRCNSKIIILDIDDFNNGKWI